MDKSKEVIISMLTENTGRAMLDSGDYYGRNWQRNQGKDIQTFEAHPRATLDFYAEEAEDGKEYTDYLGVTIDLYHYLTEKCVFSEEMDKKFYKWFSFTSKDTHWLGMMEGFVSAMQKKHTNVGCMFDSHGEPFTINSYNEECFLSQTIQAVQFSIDRTHYVLLQVHGGCDVRGGYTRPRVFEIDESFFDWARASVGSSDHTWDFDGREWEYVEQYDTRQLTIDGSPNIIKHKRLSEYDLEVVNNEVLCPISGEPLKGYFL